LYPDRNETIYYIIDIRNYESKEWDRKKSVFEFTKESDFIDKKKELNISNSLTFTMVNKELE
jgi:hypothetical protein